MGTVNTVPYATTVYASLTVISLSNQTQSPCGIKHNLIFHLLYFIKAGDGEVRRSASHFDNVGFMVGSTSSNVPPLACSGDYQANSHRTRKPNVLYPCA